MADVQLTHQHHRLISELFVINHLPFIEWFIFIDWKRTMDTLLSLVYCTHFLNFLRRMSGLIYLRKIMYNSLIMKLLSDPLNPGISCVLAKRGLLV
jgi:hypothetical protein